MANRLADARSPYLEQHKDNPVDWWPWSPEAFAEARRRDVPLLISVGYAACHWCHVMAHESFEDAEVAKLLNEYFVPIKVDREERPDVDAVYMTATQAMTGQGGWPMTVFATPDGQPFFCGTYFPRPNFVRLLHAVDAAWREQREAVVRQGQQVVTAIAQVHGAGPTTPMGAEVLDAAAAQLSDEFDETHGGFGGAPKFPPHLNLLFLLRHHRRTGNDQAMPGTQPEPGFGGGEHGGRAMPGTQPEPGFGGGEHGGRAMEIVRHTCERMARGGIYDQVAGGFARYSVDGHWTVPHFEKMLYDNALLLRVYTYLWRLTGDRLAVRVAGETAAFLLADLATAEGGFASALDADTDGVEGLTYVWTPGQLREVLGDEDGGFAADLLGVTPTGTFEHGTSVLRMTRDVDEAGEEVRARAGRVRAALRVARDRRPQPGRDDKVVAAWNGLAITALVEAARVLPDSARLAEAAVRAGTLLADVHLVDERLRRVSRDGVVGKAPGVLDDHGCVAEAFCALHQLTGDGKWLTLAGRLLDTALIRFSDGRGGFYDTADDAEALVTRPADPTDNATPSGLSALAAALTAYTALTGEVRYREAAEAALATVAPVAARHARFTGYACAVGEAHLSGPLEIAVVGTGPLVEAAWRLAPPGAVIVSGQPDQPGVPLLANRPMVGGAPTAYVCRGFFCERPVTDPADLTALLAG